MSLISLFPLSNSLYFLRIPNARNWKVVPSTFEQNPFLWILDHYAITPTPNPVPNYNIPARESRKQNKIYLTKLMKRGESMREAR